MKHCDDDMDYETGWPVITDGLVYYADKHTCTVCGKVAYTGRADQGNPAEGFNGGNREPVRVWMTPKADFGGDV